MATSEVFRIGDVIIAEMNENFSREDLTVLASNTFVVGQIGCVDNAGKVNTITNAQDDVYTITEAATTAAGSFSLMYRGDSTTVAYNVSAADLQVALRALHADLDVCSASGSAGGPYTVTITHEKKSAMFHLDKTFDSTATGATVDLGGVIIDRTTYAEQAGVICLDPIESSSDGTRTFLVRDAIVDAASLTGGSDDLYARLAEFKVADDFENQAGYGGIIVRTGPTYSQLPVT